MLYIIDETTDLLSNIINGFIDHKINANYLPPVISLKTDPCTQIISPQKSNQGHA